MHFDKQVPHRFLSPWYVRKNKREVYELSQAEIESPIYKLYNDKIVIPPAWYNYLQKHIRILLTYTGTCLYSCKYATRTCQISPIKSSSQQLETLSINSVNFGIT